MKYMQYKPTENKLRWSTNEVNQSSCFSNLKLAWLWSQYLRDDHVSNLDDWILLGLGEDSFSAGALDVETEDSEGSNVRPFSLRVVRDELVPRNINFDLASRAPSWKKLDHFIISQLGKDSGPTLMIKQELSSEASNLNYIVIFFQ